MIDFSKFSLLQNDWSKFYAETSRASNSQEVLKWLFAKNMSNDLNIETLCKRIPNEYDRYAKLKSKPPKGMYFNRPRDMQTFFVPKPRTKSGLGKPRYEPWIAKLMLREKLDLGNPGIVANVEVPYFESKSQKDGSIDLVSYNRETNALYFLELKSDESNECLIRCILEPFTYLKRIKKNSRNQLVKEFGGNQDTQILICPLIFSKLGSKPYEEWLKRDFKFKELESILQKDLSAFLEDGRSHIDYCLLDPKDLNDLLKEARVKANKAAKIRSV